MSDPSDLFIYARVTFQALYWYFSIPDWTESAAEMLMHLIRMDSGSIISPFISTFFHYPLDFIDILTSTYESEFRKLPRSPTSVTCFRCFGHALISQKSHSLFATVFISDFFIQTIYSRDSSLPSALPRATRTVRRSGSSSRP
jgi:hypothetical protein